ncbi:MAG: 30S ribosomal protein S3 [Rickettsiales bacterium]|jgi:small subunit ribosomal protein S3|nr:30S ribosomal protein S3 [Rickettsiales bacterium]
MGQKINPVGFRVSVNNNWSSVWYDDANYRKNLINDLQIQNYVAKNFKKYSISRVVLERMGENLNILIKTSKPGVLIGKKGSDMEKIKKFAENLREKNVAVKIVETEKPDMDAELVGQSIARQIENRATFKRVVKKALQSVMKYGALGVKIMISGRLNGVDISRTETYKEGSTPLQSLRSNIDYAQAEALCSYGIIGIKVWIYKKSAN